MMGVVLTLLGAVKTKKYIEKKNYRFNVAILIIVNITYIHLIIVC